MKQPYLILSFLFVVCFSAFADIIAFPGAEGFGKYAKGARASSAPTVYHVTNLNDSGTGSFREAVSASNRIVVFDVAGVIKITDRIVVSSNIYIAGQTAPGEGITIYGNGFSFSGADNCICRYLRIRMGAVGTDGKDACGIANGSNMIFDHVSVSWGRDETFSISGSECINITIQNSVIAQGLLSHSAGGLIQTDGGVTLYRNLYVDNDTRNNKIKGVNQYVNNMVYNWSSGAYLMGGDSEGQSYANCVSNYFLNGPEASVAALSGANSNYHIFALDNWWDKNRNGLLDGYEVPQGEYSGGPDFQATAYAYPELPTWSASSVVDSLLPEVGASLPYRDLLDCYVINQVNSFGTKGAIITNETENPIGTPSTWSVWSGTTRIDSDTDGMPDAWETANGLNPALASDAVVYASNGYLNIENYINSITENDSQFYLRAPLCLTTDSTTQNEVYLSWFDFTEEESGYCVEKKKNGVFSEIARTSVNEDFYTVTGLKAEETDTFRVRAFTPTLYSDYSNEWIVKTKPVPVDVLDLTTFVPDLTWNGGVDAYWNKTSANWQSSQGSAFFTDSSTVLFPNSSVRTISLSEVLPVKALVVDTDSSYVFQGSGSIAGSGSVNKTGTGTLSLQTSNTYKGATVLHQGTLEVSTLANGGVASSIGESQNYNFNCVLKGGKLNYTGASVSTDRNIKLENNAEIGVSNSSATLTLNGVIDGSGGLTKSGSGTMLFKGINTYEGATTVKEGVLNIYGSDAIEKAFTSGKSYLLSGGTLKTSGGSTTDYEYYYSPITVSAGTISSFEPYRNCYLKGAFSGSGTLYFNITYVREYLQGDWSQFSGTVYANGIGTSSDGNQFLLNNTAGIPYGRVVTSGSLTKIVCWKNASTMSLGGLSGPAGTYLSGADKQNNASTMTWVVGGAGTDETFNGVINNECSNKSYKGSTSIVKSGNGFWRLTGANLYSGTTNVQGGMLIVNGTHTGTGAVTIAEGGTLTGTGVLPGATAVQSGGTLAAGDPYLTSGTLHIGTFTLGALTLRAGSITDMEVNRTLIQNDKIKSSGAITFDGTLHLTTIGDFQAGDTYTLFTGTSYSGTFDSIVPASPGEGLKWVFANGVLSVASTMEVFVPTNRTVRIFPNPVMENGVVALDKSYKNILIRVETLNGVCLNSQTVSDQSQILLDMSMLPKGMYLVRVSGDDELNVVQKVIKGQ
jgi:autotransporter-associated beta strand protein